MNLSQLEDALIKTVTYNTESELVNRDSDEVVDGEMVFFTFFDKLGDAIGIRNFGKIVLAKSRSNGKHAFTASLPIQINDATPRIAVEKLIIQLDKAAEAVDSAVFLNDIKSFEDYAGEDKKTAFSFATYQFNHYAFAMRITVNLEVALNNPKDGKLSTSVSVLY